MFEKLISIALSAAMTLSLTACSRNTQTETTIAATTATGQAETSLTGKITAIEGSTVTLSLGSLTEGKHGDMDSQTPPDMSGSDNSQTPPDAPSGSNSQTPPEKPEGDSSQTPPEMPSDSNSQVPSGNAGQTPPDNPGSDSAQAPGNGQMPSGQPGGMDFQESGETRTLDLSNAEITKNEQSVTVDALAVDDILVLTLSTDGTAAAVQVLSAQGQSGGMPGGFGGSGEVTQGTSSDENIHTVMIYQSMSGDAQVGTSTFTMEGGSLTGTAGDLFYITNTHSIITLKNAALSNLDPSGALLRVVGNSASRGWGTAGSNGAQVELTAQAQTLEGNIFVDTISTLNLTLEDGTEFTGTVNILDNAQSSAAVDNNAVVTISEGCTWTLTGDCTITSLTNNGTLNLNGYTITLADGTVIR